MPTGSCETIEAQKLTGVVPIDEPKRLYHYDAVAGTLIVSLMSTTKESPA